MSNFSRARRSLTASDRVGDLTHGCTGRFAQNRHQVIVELPAVDIDAALLRQADRLRRRRRRLDKDRDCDQAVGVHDMRDLRRLALLGLLIEGALDPCPTVSVKLSVASAPKLLCAVKVML